MKEKWEDEMKISVSEKEREQSFKDIYTHIRSSLCQKYA